MAVYFINTNRKQDPRDEKKMIKEKFVALYYKGKKEKINLLKKGDIVLLYGTGEGVVAYGTATGEVKIRDYKNMKKFKDEEHYMQLNDLKTLKSAFTVMDMKDVTGTRQPVARAFYKMNDQVAAKILKQLEIRAHQLKLAI